MSDIGIILTVLGAVSSIITIALFVNSFMKRKRQTTNEVSQSNTSNFDNSNNNITSQGHDSPINISNTSNYYNERLTTDKKNKEQEFEDIKNIIIDFIDTSIDLMDNENNNDDCKIFEVIPALMNSVPSLITEDKNYMIWHLTKIKISNKYKLTIEQEKRITDMIVNMKPQAYKMGIFNSENNNIYLASINNSIEIKIDEYYYIPTDEIETRLEEIGNGKWDSYIMTAIKELG